MNQQPEDFEKDLDELIRLFKQIRERIKTDQFSHLDPHFTQNLDFIINNYEMMKHSIPKELISQMGPTLHQLMREFVSQLKSEFGEDLNTGPEEEKASTEKVELFDDIRKIDERLKNPGLSDEEINKLLDRRNSLLGN
jgi:hypothetical protein